MSYSCDKCGGDGDSSVCVECARRAGAERERRMAVAWLRPARYDTRFRELVSDLWESGDWIERGEHLRGESEGT